MSAKAYLLCNLYFDRRIYFGESVMRLCTMKCEFSLFGLLALYIGTRQ